MGLWPAWTACRTLWVESFLRFLLSGGSPAARLVRRAGNAAASGRDVTGWRRVHKRGWGAWGRNQRRGQWWADGPKLHPSMVLT